MNMLNINLAVITIRDINPLQHFTASSIDHTNLSYRHAHHSVTKNPLPPPTTLGVKAKANPAVLALPPLGLKVAAMVPAAPCTCHSVSKLPPLRLFKRVNPAPAVVAALHPSAPNIRSPLL